MAADVETAHRAGPARTVGRDDLAALGTLDAACFEVPWSAGTWRTELSRDDRRWRVVPAAGAAPGGLVGMAGLWLAPDAAHVLRLAVLPAWRRRGIGDRLVTALVAAAARAGHDALTLEVRASNRAAARLYGRHGFVAAGVRRGYYPDSEDAVILWRDGTAGGGHEAEGG